MKFSTQFIASFVMLLSTAAVCEFYRATACNATHTIATRKPSVCLSVWIVTKRKKLVSSFLHHIWYVRWYVVPWQQKRLMDGDHFYLKFWTKLTPLEQKRRLSASVVTPSEISSSITTRKSTASFPISLRWTVYVAPKPPLGLKNAKWPFSFKNCTSFEEILLQSVFVWALSAIMLQCIYWPIYQ